MEQKKDLSLEGLYKKVNSLDKRIRKLESGIVRSLKTDETEESPPQLPGLKFLDNESELESGIGEYGFSWLGNIVLLLGISFLTQYIRTLGYPLVSALTGYGFIAAIFFLARYIRESHSYLAYMFNLNGHILAYYITLKLHFFSADPLILNKYFGLIFLFLVLIIQGYLAIKKKSQVYAGLTLIFTLITAVAVDSTHLSLALITLTSFAAMLCYVRFGWGKALNFTVVFAYVAFFLWFMNNSVMGHEWGIRATHEFGHVYLFAIAGLYSFVTLVRQKEPDSESYAFKLVILNGIFFTLMIFLMILEFFNKDFLNITFTITAFCLGFSIVLKYFSSWKFSSAFYALYGFMAMSITIYELYDLPGAYFLLSLQSLLVVTMALWFRNKLLVIMNFVLFTFLFFAYLFSAEHTNLINYSFAIGSLVTARIMNWKKEHLEIKTEMIRGFYLLIGFFIMLYALYHGVPKQYLTLSWSMTAVMYFILSILLRSVKYRYMALGTVIAAAFYLFLVDLAQLEIIYRILAFLFLAIVSIAVSVFYTRHKKSHLSSGEKSNKKRN